MKMPYSALLKSMIHIPVVHRPHRRIGGLIHNDVLHDLAGGDLGFQPVAVHFGVKVWRKIKLSRTEWVLRQRTMLSVSASVMGRRTTFSPVRMGKIFHTGSFRVF